MSHRQLLLLCSLVLLSLTLPACRPHESEGDVVENVALPAVTQAVQGYDCSTVSEVPTAECRALVALYEATDGPSWIGEGATWEKADSAWLGNNNPCGWGGVTCVGGHVDMLTLYFNGLQGRLPAELADLTALRVLDLHNNSIGGELPAELGQLANLESLDLSANELTGAIPPSLGRLTKLNSLSLAHNGLSGAIPAELGRLAALRTMDLAHNELSGEIPATLADLGALESLRLNENQLEGEIPAALGDSPTLVEVDLSFNRLSGPVPAGLEPSLTRALWGNRLQGTVDVRAGETVSALGVQFMGEPAVAAAIWPEELPLIEPGPQSPWWDSLPAHARLTLVRTEGSLDHAPMGINVACEAQIHVYPVAALDEANREQAGILMRLLDGEQELNAVEPLPLLPPTNAHQVFRAQVARLEFATGSGIRYLTQYSQGPTPVANDQLFYTFQGLSGDGATYVAAFFPVSAPFLPATLTEAAALPGTADFLRGTDDVYLAEIVQALDELAGADFSPSLDQLDALIQSLSAGAAEPAPVVASLEGRWPDEGEAVDGEPVLQWEAFPGAVQYELVVVDDDAYPPFVAFSHSGQETVVPVTPALAPGSYSWTVRAQDEQGNTLAELNRQFLVKAALTLTSPAAGETVDATPLLQWEAFAGAVQYQVIVVDDGAYPPQVVFERTVTETSAAVELSLENGRHYTWTVRAQGDDGRTVAELNSDFEVIE